MPTVTSPTGRLDGFLTVVKSIDNFWLYLVKLPSNPRLFVPD